jgi:predicted GNAT family N-acyltransferase
MYKLSSKDVFYVDVVDWADSIAELKKIRASVFIDEQNVPVELEWDGLDESCTHFIVRSDNGVIATARLTPDGQIGRMAVLPDYRGLGIGTSLLLKILSYAKESGHDRLYIHAQKQAILFYKRNGFIPEGNEFMDAGIPHLAMHLDLCSL